MCIKTHFRNKNLTKITKKWVNTFILFNTVYIDTYLHTILKPIDSLKKFEQWNYLLLNMYITLISVVEIWTRKTYRQILIWEIGLPVLCTGVWSHQPCLENHLLIHVKASYSLHFLTAPSWSGICCFYLDILTYDVFTDFFLFSFFIQKPELPDVA